MPQYSPEQWQKIYNASPYIVKPLRWSKERNEAWKEDVMGIIIDMYVEQKKLQPELPLFEHRKKTSK
jgi:hypothetical protein